MTKKVKDTEKSVKNGKQRIAKNGKREKRAFGISIRLQLMMGFLVPVLFIVLVGGISDLRASNGLTENYTASSMNALRMTVNSLDESMKTIQSNVAELAQDSTIMSYSLGGLKSSASKTSETKSKIENSLVVKETASSMIGNIHIIPVEDVDLLTTQRMETGDKDSIIGAIANSEDAWLLESGSVKWSTAHPCIDEQLGIGEEDYAFYCSRMLNSGSLKALVVIDVSLQSVEELLENLDFGAGSQVSFITVEGREITDGGDIVMSELAVFQEQKDNAEEGVSEYVQYNGQSYYFMMEKSEITNGYVCAMVPKDTITASSKSIRNITVVLVVIACAIALLISGYMVRMITHNIQGSVRRLDKVSQGELIQEQSAKKASGNEFGKLHNAIYTTIERMRGLVETVKDMIEQVSKSGNQVSNSSNNVSRVVEEMGAQIEEIRENIKQENEEILSCNDQMEELSIKIKQVSSNILEIITQIEQSEEIISNGMHAVGTMTTQSNDTRDVTEEVQNQVNLLGTKIEDIAHFVEIIQAIAEETNLLSLNASIEAARAGENGKGFSVVAEEIRKLADNSAETAQTIQKVISEVRGYSVSAIGKTQSAENIVSAQVESVQNTSEAFRKIDEFMNHLAEQMKVLTDDVEEMNTKRHTALSAMKNISKLSEGTVHSADQVNDALRIQITCTEEMEQEADRLKENMKKLEEAVASFKLSEEEIVEQK